MERISGEDGKDLRRGWKKKREELRTYRA